MKARTLCVFALLVMSYAYFFPRWAEWNQNSRMDLTLAIVEQGRFAIDDYYEGGDVILFFYRAVAENGTIEYYPPEAEHTGPLPQAFLRGKLARSTSWTSIPPKRARLMAVADPAGPAPMMIRRLIFAPQVA